MKGREHPGCGRVYRPVPPAAAILLLLLITSRAISATPVLTCQYVEGTVMIQGNGSLLEAGMVLSGREILELASDGYVEIRTGTGMIRLAGPGEFSLADIGEGGLQQQHFATALSDRVRRIAGEHSRRDGTVAGVRGDFGGAPETPGLWSVEPGGIDGFAEELHKTALDALLAGRMEEAEILLEEALLYASPGGEGVIRLDLAALLLHQDRYAETIELVRASRPREIAPEMQVQLELLAAEAAMMRGDRKEAALALNAIGDLAPGSAWATAARRVLEELGEGPPR